MMTMMMMMMMMMMTMMISMNIQVMTRTKMIMRVKMMGNQVEEEGMVEGAVAKVARVEGGNNLKNQRSMWLMTMIMVMMMMMGTKTVLHGQCGRTSHSSKSTKGK